MLVRRLISLKSFNIRICLSQGKFVHVRKLSTNIDVEEREREFTQLRIQSGIHEWQNDPQHILVVQPKIRWGSESSSDDECNLKLEEACTLIKTLPGFSIAK